MDDEPREVIRQAALYRLAGYPAAAIRLCRDHLHTGPPSRELIAISEQARVDAGPGGSGAFAALAQLWQEGYRSARLCCFLAQIRDRQTPPWPVDRLLHQAGVMAGEDPYLLAELGNAHSVLGDHPAACAFLEKAATLVPDSGTIMTLLAAARLMSGDEDAALSAAQRAWDCNPHTPHAARALLPAAICTESEGDAQTCLDWLAEQPDERFAEVISGCADVLERLRRPQQAATLFRSVVDAFPDSAYHHGRYGELLLKAYRPEEARHHLMRAQSQGREQAGIHAALGRCYIQLGDLKAAEDVLRQSIADTPRQIAAYSLLAEIDPRLLNETDAAHLSSAIDAGGHDPETRATGLIALARIREAQGETDRPFSHFARANELLDKVCHSRGFGYDPKAVEREFADIRDIFSKDRLHRLVAQGVAGRRYVFIVGMPRSGTTLTDQILSAHPDITSRPERTVLHEFWQAIRQARDRGEDIDGYLAAHLAQWRERYEAVIEAGASPGQMIIDKLPLNFQHIGLITLLLPGARIIYARRDAIDTCLSIYRLRFPHSFSFANDLDNLAHYYRQHAALMRHWLTASPLPVRTSQYEDLVGDTEGCARALVEFLGLDWDPACLDFYRADRPVFTLSGTQVRRPIYRSAVGRWRRYRTHLPPALLALADEAEATAGPDEPGQGQDALTRASAAGSASRRPV